METSSVNGFKKYIIVEEHHKIKLTIKEYVFVCYQKIKNGIMNKWYIILINYKFVIQKYILF